MTGLLVLADRVRTAQGIEGDALLLANGRVAAVGDAEELRTGAGGATPEDRYPGAVIVPGLRDAHFHPLPYVSVLQQPSLQGAGDLAEVLERVRRAARQLGPGAPVIANRLDDEALEERRLPTRADLDEAVADRPVFLNRYCGHVAVANTAALQEAGLGPESADPKGGAFDRDPEGALTGVLRETAVEVVRSRLPHASRPLPEQILETLGALATLGLTGLGAIVSMKEGPWCGVADELHLLKEVAADLPLKLSVLLVAEDGRQLEEGARLLDGCGPRLRFLGMKGFADGSLGGHTAALAAPYRDRPDSTGTLRLDPQETGALARACLDLGGKVAIHAIGDRANARVLDLFEELLEEGASPEDLRVEHASVLSEQEVVRFARTGVTASVQPAFLVSETSWLERRLGRERMPLAYPFRTLWEAGVPLAGGSDCPVEPPAPLLGMAAARDRSGLNPAEGLGAEAALALFTDGAARAMGEPRPLAPGSPADFVVLDRDPVTTEPDALRAARVLATWVDGRPVSLPPEAASLL